MKKLRYIFFGMFALLLLPAAGWAASPWAQGGLPGELKACEAQLEACLELPCVIFPGDGWPEDAYPSGGEPLAYEDNEDGTFTDLNTGLMWEVKEDYDNVPDYTNPHDADNVYTWTDTQDGDYVNPDGTVFTEFLAELNEVQFGGYSDWRLPTFKELLSLVDFYNTDPPWSIPGVMIRGQTWSSTANAVTESNAWYWRNLYRAGQDSPKYFFHGVRAVRTGLFPTALMPTSPASPWGQGGLPGELKACEAQLEACLELPCVIFPGDGWPEDAYPSGGEPLAYEDNEDGTFTDLNTGLIWEIKTDDGSIHDVDNVYAWTDMADDDPTNPDGSAFTEFLATLNGIRFAGYDDWRLPTIKELQGIVDYSKRVQSESIPGQTNGLFLSSTSSWQDQQADHVATIYIIESGSCGEIWPRYKDKQYGVRAVRDP